MKLNSYCWITSYTINVEPLIQLGLILQLNSDNIY